MLAPPASEDLKSAILPDPRRSDEPELAQGAREDALSPSGSPKGRCFAVEPGDDARHADEHAILAAHLRVGAWSLVLFVTFLANRCVNVWFGVPSDGHESWGTLFFVENLQATLLYGFVQAFFVGVADEGRLAHLLCGAPEGGRRGRARAALFVATLLLSGPCFGAISDVTALESSLSNGRDQPGAIAAYLVLAAVVAAVIAWHFAYARRAFSKPGWHAYAYARVAVLVFYAGYSAALLLADDAYDYHHYFLAWAVSLIARFRHPLSASLLAISTGIFVQGVAAYGAAELFSAKTTTYTLQDGSCFEYYDCYRRDLC